MPKANSSPKKYRSGPALVWRQYKKGARQRKHEFALTRQHFDSLTQANCFYCGSSPFNSVTTARGESYHYNGIDRLNQAFGYIPGNVVPCCPQCNFLKGPRNYGDFIKLIGRIASGHGTKTRYDVLRYGFKGKSITACKAMLESKPATPTRRGAGFMTAAVA